MKNLSIYILLLCLLTVSCNKEYDPQHEINLIGDWEITKYQIGNTDILAQYDSIIFKFDDNKNIIQEWKTDPYSAGEVDEGASGKWEVVDYYTLDLDILTPEAGHCNNYGETRHEYIIMNNEEVMIGDNFHLEGRCTPLEPVTEERIVIIEATRI